MSDLAPEKSHIEREAKFEADDLSFAGVLQTLKRIGATQDGPSYRHMRTYTYYDENPKDVKNGRLLLRAGITLRVVGGLEGGKWRIDLKTGTGKGDSRNEVSSPARKRKPTIGDVKAGAAVAAKRLPGGIDSIPSGVSFDGIEPVACFDGAHDKAIVSYREATFEISLDAISASGQEVFRELEVEYKSGEQDGYSALVADLSKTLSRMPIQGSKIKRFLDRAERDAVIKAVEQVARVLLPKQAISRHLPVLPGSFPSDRTAITGLCDRLAADGAAMDTRHVLDTVPALIRMSAGRSADLFAATASAFGLVVPPRPAPMFLPERPSPAEQAEALFGRNRAVPRQTESWHGMLMSAMAMRELGAKPDILILDDLPFRSTNKDQRAAWVALVGELSATFTVHAPPLPILPGDITEHRASPLLMQVLDAELARMPRLLGAIVDLYWDQSGYSGSGWFGFELIRLLRQLKPNLPIFVWSNLADGESMQLSFQLGATYWFDKQEALRCGTHPKLKGVHNAYWMDAGKLWFHIWNWEEVRYQPPIAAKSQESLVFEEGSESARENLQKLLSMYRLSRETLNSIKEPPIAALLRCIIPDASRIEVLQILGKGHSGNPAPFVVRGKSADGVTMKPLQVKIARDWRALARERKGYLDVMSPHLGPTISHVLRGPYRIGNWSIMAQSYAAPEEVYAVVGTHKAPTLKDMLIQHREDGEYLECMVDRIFDGILSPFYGSSKERARIPCHYVFHVAGPAHIRAKCFGFVQDDPTSAPDADFSPDSLSIKNTKARAEEAYRRWRKLAETIKTGGSSLDIAGLRIATIEPDNKDWGESRLRLLDPTLGVKLDLTPCDAEMSRRWNSLVQSPLKLAGLQVRVRIEVKGKDRDFFLNAWSRTIEDDLLTPNDIRTSPLLFPVGNIAPWDYIQRCLPVDYAEEFRMGPVHGDLNVMNILFHENDKALFPWLIDFDQARKRHPIVFDLVKLEIEASHRVAASYFERLVKECDLDVCARRTKSKAGSWFTGLDQVVLTFETLLEDGTASDLSSLWSRLTETRQPSDDLKRSLDGFFRYVKRLRQHIFQKLNIRREEYLVARLFYGVTVLKFKSLYDKNHHEVGPFAAQYILLKTQCALLFHDKHRGIEAPAVGASGVGSDVIATLIRRIRESRGAPNPKGLGRLVREETSLRPPASVPAHFKKEPLTFALVRVFDLLQGEKVRGSNRWFEEALWYVRDFGIGDANCIAAFAKAMVRASRDWEKPQPSLKGGHPQEDFASTGRVANVYPTRSFFGALSKANPSAPIIKVSSRGESGGTIDVLEQAGIPIARSMAEIDVQIGRDGWCVAEPVGDICGVDSAMMDLRKNIGCMKVDDLVIASISAKKLAVEIMDFSVEIVGGYDAKFQSLRPPNVSSKDKAAIQKIWSDVWRFMTENKGSVSLSEHLVNSNRFQWTELDPTSGIRMAIIGSSVLAAKIIEPFEPSLLGKVPNILLKRQGAIRTVIQKAMTQDIEGAAQIELVSGTGLAVTVRWLASREGAMSPAEIPKELKDFKVLVSGIRLLKLTITTTKAGDFPWEPRVPFFDSMYSRLNESRHPLTSVILTSNGNAMSVMLLAPEDHSIFKNPERHCWDILRHGFDFLDCSVECRLPRRTGGYEALAVRL